MDVKFKRGVVYGLKGTVGCGKSTFLQTLIGLNKNYSDTIEFDGQDINVLDGHFFDSHVSYLSAESGFFSGSLYDNFVLRNCNGNKVMASILRDYFGNRVFDYQNLYIDDIESIPMSTGQRKRLLFFDGAVRPLLTLCV